MTFDDELNFEEAFVNLLRKNCGWENNVLKNPTENDLITNWASILYDNNKGNDILNGCPLTNGEMNQILTQIQILKTPLALNTFINGKTVTITRDNQDDQLHFGKKVSLKIYDRMEIAGGKSRYQIAEQPIFKTNNTVYPARRGDVMLLINGMPVFHIELKKSNVSITQAQSQIEKYMINGVYTGIFSLIQIYVTMNPEEAVYYANPGPLGKFNPDYYFHWENFNNDLVLDWKSFTTKVLSIPMAHEMIGFYTIPDDSDGVLKVMRSYQFFAAAAISDKVARTNWTKSHQHGGYVWHTTGSGKTMTSFKAAQLISNSKDAEKVIFLLDRIELGDQSLINFRNFADPSESVQSTEDTQVLISKLKSDSVDDKLIVTSIQKMSRVKDDSSIKTRDLEKIKSKKIVFIIDECHRDQKGEMHQDIKRTFPNAIYFGFTGTPDHEYTADIFGDELHRYTIVHGIRDKNVLGFDAYKVSTYDEKVLREVVGLSVCRSSSVSEAMSDLKTKDIFLYYMNHGGTPCSMQEIESYIPKTQYETIEHEKAVVKDIVSNWIIRSVNSKFHAIFSTSSIAEAISYYRLFKETESSMKVTALFDPSDSNDLSSISKMEGITDILLDYKNMFGNEYTISEYQNFKKDVCARLSHKKPYLNLKDEDKLDLIIVVDQLLTGFDSKWINTLYIDRMLKGKNFIQAISRTNRLHGPDKPHGTIVWYRYPNLMEKYLEEAVDNYSGNRPFGVFVNKLDENLKQMNYLFNQIIDLFESVAIINFERNSEDIDWKMKFAKLFSDFNKCLISAKVQSFDWKQVSYDFVKEDGLINNIILNISETTYLILVQRYKELFLKNTSQIEIPFDINTYITEIKTNTIDDGYMNSKFKLFTKNISAGNPEAKENALKELYKSFATLTQDEQKYAKQFLIDLETGKIQIDVNKTFREYITEYQFNAYNDHIRKFSEEIGIDEIKLRSLMILQVNESNINEYGRLDDLISTLNIYTAKEYFEKVLGTTITLRKVKVLVDEELRRFIISGGYEV